MLFKELFKDLKVTRDQSAMNIVQRSTLEILKCLYDVDECLTQYSFFLFDASRAGISFICST